MSRSLKKVFAFSCRVLGWALAGAAILSGETRRVVRIPFGKAPPMVDIDSAGRPRGFAVETMNEAAARAGLEVAWVPGSTLEGNNQALLSGGLDVILGPASAERRRLFFVSEPWWSTELVALVAVSSSIRREGDLTGVKMAFAPGTRIIQSNLHIPEPVLNTPNAVAAAEAVCTGKADAAVFAAMYLREVLASAPEDCRGFGLRTIDISTAIDFVINTRHEDAAIAKQLKKQLDDLTADGTLTAIAARNPPMSTPQATRLEERLRIRYQSRVWQTGLAAAVVVALMVGGALVRLQRSRKRLAEVNRRLGEDLQARIRAEQALYASEQRFRALLDSAPQTVLAVTQRGIIAFANAKAEAMFGYPADDLIGKSVSVIFPGRMHSDAKDWLRHLGATAGDPRPGQGGVEGIRKDGTSFPVDVAYGALPVPDDMTIVFIQDTSERLALEHQLRESQKLDSIGQLAGGIAHDFNNLLTVIHGYLELIMADLPADSGLRGSAEKISQAATKAAVLTRQLLTFSRGQPSQPRTVSLNEVIGQLEGMLRPLIREDVELRLCLEASPDWIHADPGQLEQVLINLVVNARDAMPEGGKLTIATSNSDDGASIRMRVGDTGIGMSPEVHARIFDPFFTTKEPGKGTGLGLSVVYGIVRQSGGSITVDSAPQQGTLVEICFPATEREPLPQQHEQPWSAASVPGNETVLLAEDESALRDFLSRVLRLNGYTVFAAANGREAQVLMDGPERPFDLLLTDTIMPEVGGIALSRRFTALYPGVPILRMTGYADGEDHRDSGIPVLNKPFTAQVLLEKVREVLAAQRGRQKA